MQSPAAIRGSAAAMTTSLKMFSRRSTKQLSALAGPGLPPSHSPTTSSAAADEVRGSSKASINVVDGKLNYRVRKRRQPAVTSKAPWTEPVADANPPPGSQDHLPIVLSSQETTEVEISTTVVVAGSPSTLPKRHNARVLKRLAEAEQSLRAAELSKSRSRPRTARRVVRKTAGAAGKPQPLDEVEIGLPAPTAGILQNAAAPELLPSSLSEISGGPISKDLMEVAIPPVLPGHTLTAAEDIAKALEHLKSADPLLKAVIEMHDAPKFEKCDSAFTALVRSIVFQQLATRAAAAIYGRLVTLCEGLDKLTPTTISQLTAEQMRAVGLSARKSSYLHDLAANFLSGALSDSSVLDMDDESLMKALTAVKGIGMWSVHMFMLFSLHKADVLPVTDLGVRKGLQKLYQLKELPSPAQAEKIACSWQPYRSLGSWYMWRVISNIPPLKP